MNSACPKCLGDGHLTYLGGPGYFSERFGNWLPDECVSTCPVCRGNGLALDIEVLADRHEELRLLLGVRVAPRRDGFTRSHSELVLEQCEEAEEELPF